MKNITILFLCIAWNATGQPIPIFRGVEFRELPASIEARIRPYTGTMERITVEDPVFPLYREKESHLVCTSFRAEAGYFPE